MKKQIVKINQQVVNYTLRSNRRVSTMRLAIYNDGSLVVTKPYGLPKFIVNYFLRSNAKIILKKIKSNNHKVSAQARKSHYLKYRSEARKYIEEKAQAINKYYNFVYQRISIRNQKSRWGSCSQKGNLNFNYKLLFLPAKLSDYIIAHELCHLQEMNHSRKFWGLVGEYLPNYKDSKKELKSIKDINII